MSTHDIVIVGAGVVGATAALALAKNTNLCIGILDSKPMVASWQKHQFDFRVSAISLASERIFQKLNVWEKISNKRISPYRCMKVWEEQGPGKIQFDHHSISASALGYIIEDSVLRASLYETLTEFSNIEIFDGVKLQALEQKSDCIELIADKPILSTKLLVAADGANSWVRDQVGIALTQYDYEHTAIVATVKTTKSHDNIAWQRFLKTGPLAFLPLSDPYTSSIVWSTVPSHASELLAMDENGFREALSRAFEMQLGEVSHVDARYHFPLQMRHAKNYVLSRIALIGDAAHTIHPLAGQGVNMGILDAITLAEVVFNANQKQRDFASLPTLRRYERWRKSDNLIMLSMVDLLKKLFMSDNVVLGSLRGFGLNFTNRVDFLKNFFAKYAVGNRGDLPDMAN